MMVSYLFVLHFAVLIRHWMIQQGLNGLTARIVTNIRGVYQHKLLVILLGYAAKRRQKSRFGSHYRVVTVFVSTLLWQQFLNQQLHIHLIAKLINIKGKRRSNRLKTAIGPYRQINIKKDTIKRYT